MKRKHHIELPLEAIADFCRQNHIRKLSIFGSILRDDFSPDSDVDVLVEFEPNAVVGWEIVTMRDELSEIIGHRVDLLTPNFLSPTFRDDVLATAQAIYEQAG